MIALEWHFKIRLLIIMMMWIPLKNQSKYLRDIEQIHSAKNKWIVILLSKNTLHPRLYSKFLYRFNFWRKWRISTFRLIWPMSISTIYMKFLYKYIRSSKFQYSSIKYSRLLLNYNNKKMKKTSRFSRFQCRSIKFLK